jgi:hypothetical protein
MLSYLSRQWAALRRFWAEWSAEAEHINRINAPYPADPFEWEEMVKERSKQA